MESSKSFAMLTTLTNEMLSSTIDSFLGGILTNFKNCMTEFTDPHKKLHNWSNEFLTSLQFFSDAVDKSNKIMNKVN